MKNKYGWLFLLALLVGCSNESPQGVSSAGKVAEVLAGMEAKGELPVLDRSATLAGVDADKNGIRDDIDKLIVAQHKGVEETKAMQQLARANQYALTAGIKTKAEARASADRVGKGIDCVFYRSGSDAAKLVDLINDSAINTRARKLEEDRIDQMLSGMVFGSLPWSEACE